MDRNNGQAHRNSGDTAISTVGSSLRMIAEWRSQYPEGPPVSAGRDSWTGLPNTTFFIKNAMPPIFAICSRFIHKSYVPFVPRFIHKKRYVPICSVKSYVPILGSQFLRRQGLDIRRAQFTASVTPCTARLPSVFSTSSTWYKTKLALEKMANPALLAGPITSPRPASPAAIMNKSFHYRPACLAGWMELTHGSVSGIPGSSGKAGPIPASSRGAPRGRRITTFKEPLFYNKDVSLKPRHNCAKPFSSSPKTPMSLTIWALRSGNRDALQRPWPITSEPTSSRSMTSGFSITWE